MLIILSLSLTLSLWTVQTNKIAQTGISSRVDGFVSYISVIVVSVLKSGRVCTPVLMHHRKLSDVPVTGSSINENLLMVSWELMNRIRPQLCYTFFPMV